MKKKFLSQKTSSQFMFSLGLFLMCVNLGWGQSPPIAIDAANNGDYRSLATGIWSAPGTWQVRTGVATWATATVVPTTTNTVYIQAGHTVTLTEESDCYSLHIEKTGILAAGASTVNVYGKLRCYLLAAAETGASDAHIGADNTTMVVGMITTTAGSTTLRFKGITRNLNFSGEWAASNAVVSAEFALDATATGTLAAALRLSNLTLTTGTYPTGNPHVITGDCTIKTGAKFVITRAGSTAGSLGNIIGTPAGKLEIEAGGILDFRTAAPNINFTTFVNNGTVTYSTLGVPVAGNFMTSVVPTVDVNTYNNLIINNSAGVTATASVKAITGVLTVSDNSTLNTGGFVVLKSTATKTATVAPIGTGIISGNVTVERYIPAGQRAYRFLSSPVTTTTFIDTNWQAGTHITGAGGTNGFDATTGNNPSIFTYNNTTPAWNAVTNTNATVLAAGVPYLTYIRGSRTASLTVSPEVPPVSIVSDATTLSATGTLKKGDVIVSGLNETLDGFSAVGNPYQAQVDMAAIFSGVNATSSNLNTGFYYVVDPSLGTKGAYLAVDVTVPAAPHISQYLQPGQACFVKTLAAGAASLTFKEVHKSGTAAQTTIFKTKNTTMPSIGLSLYDSASNRLDVLKIAFDASETNDVNQNDASKMTNFDESLATSNNGKLLSIEKRAMPTDSDEIPLNITKYRGTSYSLKAEGSSLTETPYLVDSFTGTTTEIPVDGTMDYAYTVDAGNSATTDASRFKLIYAKTLKTIDNTIAGFTLYPNPSKSNSFSVVVPQSLNKASLIVSNLLGQKLYSQNDLQSGTTVKVNVSNVKTAGVYLVSLTSEGKTATTKWIVE
jgi:hypothetical protein